MKQALLILCAIELLLVTWLQNKAGPFLSPVLLLAVSLGIGFVYLRNRTNSPVTSMRSLQAPPLLVAAIQVMVFLVLSYLVFKTNKTIWWWQATQDKGIDKSDIIPQITTLVKRFLAHEQPYYPITYHGYTLFPTYLPFQWMPYIATELLHKDYRWVPVIALWLSSLYFFIRSRLLQQHNDILQQLVVPAWPLVVWYTIIMYDNDQFKLTVEALIAAYYLFVTVNITGRHVWSLAIGISVCLLSRYSIICWVPLCVGCYLLAGRKRDALVITAIITIMFIICYWLPFLRKDPAIFMKGYEYYTVAAYSEWRNDLSRLNGKFYVYNGFGFTSWALRLIPGDLRDILAVYQKMHLCLCLLTVCALFYLYCRKDSIELSRFLLFSLKIYLAVFYAFIPLPYKYLYLVPVIITSTLLADDVMIRRKPIVPKGIGNEE